MTEQEAYVRVLEKLHLTNSQLDAGIVAAQFTDARQAFSEEIAASRDPVKRQILRSTFTVTVTSGTGDLTTALTDAEPLLSDFANGWEVYNTGDTPYPYQFIADKPAFLLDQPAGDLGWFTVSKKALLVIDSLGARDASASFTVTGNVTCTLANVPVQYGDEFVNILAAMVSNGLQVPNAGVGQQPG